MNVKIVETWKGNNYEAVVKAIVGHNTEIRIRVQGKKLIVKQDDFYRCIPKGCPVEIPENDMIEEDPPVPVEEERLQPIGVSRVMTPEQEQMYREWGLTP